MSTGESVKLRDGKFTVGGFSDVTADKDIALIVSDITGDQGIKDIQACHRGGQ